MKRFLNYVGYVLLISSIFIFGLKGMSAEMGISVVASTLFLAFVNLDKFRKFKGAGFEAELKQTVDVANATIENLKEVAKPLIETNFILLAKANRIPDVAFNKTHELFDQLVKLQSKIGLEGEDLEKSKLSYLYIHAWDMVKDISHNIELSGQKQFHQISKEIIGSRSFEQAPDIKKFNELVSDMELNRDCKRKLSALKDYYAKYQL